MLSKKARSQDFAGGGGGEGGGANERLRHLIPSAKGARKARERRGCGGILPQEMLKR